MKRLLLIFIALLLASSAFSQGLRYGTQSIAGSAPTKGATDINAADDLETFTHYIQDRWGNTNATLSYNPVEIYETATSKMVRYIIPGTSTDVVRLSPQSFSGYDSVHFTVTEWSSGIADTVGSSSSVNIRVNGGLYPAITKPIQFVPIPVKHYAIGATDISGATQDIEMLGLYEIPNARNYSFIYMVTGSRTANATEEIIIRGIREKTEN